MAAIMRSSVVQIVRRAFSGEGTLSVRALHTGRDNPTAYASSAQKNLNPAYASRAKKNLNPAEVDRLSKKIDNSDARKELAIGLVRQRKLSKLLGKALFYMFLASLVGAYMLGQNVARNQLRAKKCQASGEKKAE